MRQVNKRSWVFSAWKCRARFSLRVLFVVFTLASLGTGFFFNRIQNERTAAEAIAAASGEIVYNWEIRPTGSNPSVPPEQPGPEWLHRYLGPHWFGGIVEVRLSETMNPGKSNDFTLVGPYLVKLSGLRTLSVSSRYLSHTDFELLGRLTQLEELSLRAESIIEFKHAQAMAGARNLRKLRLAYAKISAKALGQLASLPRLREIVITCDSYNRLTGLPLKQHYLDDEAAEALSKFPALRSVMLFHTKITDDGVEALCNLQLLETLVVSSPHVTSATFERIAQLQNLKHLGTWEWRIDDADISKLRSMPNLISLDLLTNLTNASVPYLLSLPRLEKLRLRGDEVNGDSIQNLSLMKKLRWLNLSDTAIDKNSDAAAMLRASLPGCRIALPKTEIEKQREREFNAWKWGGLRSIN